jgi:hypothetical protein
MFQEMSRQPQLARALDAEARRQTPDGRRVLQWEYAEADRRIVLASSSRISWPDFQAGSKASSRRSLTSTPSCTTIADAIGHRTAPRGVLDGNPTQDRFAPTVRCCRSITLSTSQSTGTPRLRGFCGDVMKAHSRVRVREGDGDGAATAFPIVVTTNGGYPSIEFVSGGQACRPVRRS